MPSAQHRPCLPATRPPSRICLCASVLSIAQHVHARLWCIHAGRHSCDSVFVGWFLSRLLSPLKFAAGDIFVQDHGLLNCLPCSCIPTVKFPLSEIERIEVENFDGPEFHGIGADDSSDSSSEVSLSLSV